MDFCSTDTRSRSKTPQLCSLFNTKYFKLYKNFFKDGEVNLSAYLFEEGLVGKIGKVKLY